MYSHKLKLEKYIGTGASLWNPPCCPAILNTVAEMYISIEPNLVLYM